MKKSTILGGISVLALLVASFLVDATVSDAHLTGYPPTAPDTTHWLGTDDRGRDALARLIVGYRNSFLFAVSVSFVGCLLGFLFGALQVLAGKKADFIACRFEEAASSIPFIVILMYLSSRFSGSSPVLFICWALNTSIPIAYLARAEILRAKEQDYLVTARMHGASNFYLLRVHLLAVCAAPLFAYFPIFVAGHLSTLAALDYLGLGMPPPTATLGELLRQGRENVRAWWILIPAILSLVFTLWGLNGVTERVRRRWNLT